MNSRRGKKKVDDLHYHTDLSFNISMRKLRGKIGDLHCNTDLSFFFLRF